MVSVIITYLGMLVQSDSRNENITEGNPEAIVV
jgi:hypothetical protein